MPQRRFAPGRLVVTLAAGVVLAASLPVYAAEVTDVLDAFDDHNPYDLSLRVRYGQESRSSFIAREVRCLSQDQIGAKACQDQSRTLLTRELSYQSTKQTMYFDLRVGVYHDVELNVSLPLVIGYSWKHGFADGVDRSNSTIQPNNNRDALFAADYQSTDRGGLGDIVFGLKFAPTNWYRDSALPTLMMGMEYTIPSGEPMAVDNKGVGQGIHELHFFMTISRRALRVLEPWFNIHTRLRFPSTSGLFKEYGATQRQVGPGHVIGTSFGGELIPWEDREQDARVELNFGFRMDYIFRGREYTEIWESLASPDNPCQISNGCYNNLHYKSDLNPATGRHNPSIGITDVEQYGQFAGWTGLHYQPVKHFQVSATAQYSVDSPHFITFGDYGVDLDNKGGVQQANSANPPQNEYSPTFLPSLDAPGTRLRVQDVSVWTIMISIAGKL